MQAEPVLDGVADAGQVGVKFMVASGLLWKLNSELLHPLGIALSVQPLDGDGDGNGPVQLGLVAAPDGVWTWAEDLAEQRAAAWAVFTDNVPLICQGLLKGVL